MNTKIERLLQVLFSTCPPTAADSPSAVVRQIEAYERALAYHDVIDVEEAVNRFLQGRVTGFNSRFAPTAAQLGEVVRKVQFDRLDAERRAKPPALPAPDIDKTPESQERVRKLAAEAIERLASTMRTEDATKAKEAKDRQERNQKAMDKRFAPSTDPYSMAKRLGFTVGDPENERHVA